MPCGEYSVLRGGETLTLHPTEGRLRPVESTSCPAEETLRSHGVDTVTPVREASFWWSASLPRAQSLRGAPCARVTKFRVPRVPGASSAVGAIWDISGWR